MLEHRCFVLALVFCHGHAHRPCGLQSYSFFSYFYETELGPKLGLVVLAGFSWSPFLADSSLAEVFAFVGKHMGLI